MPKPEQSLNQEKSMFGDWEKAEGMPEGFFTNAEKPEDFTTDEFANHAKISRSRWDLMEFLKLKINDLLQKK